MRILSIESSCDETSAAVLEDQNGEIKVLSNVTATSLSIHATTGGIIPENAARMQVKYIMPVIIEALTTSIRHSGEKRSDDARIDSGQARMTGENWEQAHAILETSIDAIAVTYGPGLIGSLLVGVETAKTLSYVFNKPLIPVNHLLAHIYANFIKTSRSEIRHYKIASTPGVRDQKSEILNSPFPFIGLIVSGGHTDLLHFEQSEKYTWLGGTRDDAAGEALDKIGRLLSLPYPAGPEIERRANLVLEPTIKFKSPIINEDNFDFSFSGLKTEALRFVQKNENMADDLVNQVCFGVQKAMFDVLVKKTLKAAEEYNVKNILIGGGVSANQTFIDQLKLNASRLTLNPHVFSPEKTYCTDNAAMIGVYALMNYKTIDWQKMKADPELYFA